jgi:hypothetical protein
MVDSARFRFLFYASAMALLLILAAGGLHFHSGGGFHEDCPLCLLYASLSTVVVPALIFVLVLAVVVYLSEGHTTSHHTGVLPDSHASRGPPASGEVRFI